MRALLVAALLLGFLFAGVKPASAQSSVSITFDSGSDYPYTIASAGANAQWVGSGGYSGNAVQSAVSTDPNSGGCGTSAGDAYASVGLNWDPSWTVTSITAKSKMDTSSGLDPNNSFVVYAYISGAWVYTHGDSFTSRAWITRTASETIAGATQLIIAVQACWGHDLKAYLDDVVIQFSPPGTATPTATFTPSPSPTPLLVWLPTTDYRPICTVVSDLNLTETAVAPSPFPSLVVPTMATYVLQVPTLHVPTMVLPGAPTLTPSLSPTASETPWPTLNLPTVTPTNTRTPTPTLTCRLPDDVYPIIDVGGLVPEREPQCFRMIPLIDWDIPPINLVLFTTPEVNVHIPAVDFCVTWLPLRLSILGMDFTALLAVGLALLGARFIMGFRKEL
ncbi:hypothetical protein ANRL4_02622 [Anaerolineae bacterium]|nr:hypothetical protein ANRL4_02622 [Anaerolineae bacterium]